jgi:DNA-binding MarR family transcriptional regulator
MNEQGSRITELALQAGMTKQSMSALVYRLEECGYLKRKDDPQDARAVIFVFTSKGEALKNRAQLINYQFEKKWEEKLGAVEYERFRTMMQKLVEVSE